MTTSARTEGQPADVSILGSGVAGLMAAAVAADGQAQVQVLTDRGFGTSNSSMAQGGLQYPTQGSAAIDRFRRDIVASGGDGVDPTRLEQFLQDVRPAIEQLEIWGLQLDADPDGALLRVGAGGLSEPRVVMSGDQIGQAVGTVLRERVKQHATVHTRCRVVTLQRPDASTGLWTIVTEEGRHFRSRAVVVASGGRTRAMAGELGEVSTNPPNRNDELQEVLRSLSLEEVDADRFQYQPYGIVASFGGATARCVPESIAQMGARVVDASGAPLAPLEADRLTLCEAMWAARDAGRCEVDGNGRVGLRLTLSTLSPDVISQRYPGLHRWLENRDLVGADLLVWPALHYQLGGFRAEASGASCESGLFLAGEILGGLHGRNRLMGNGITESITTGWRAGLSAVEFVQSGS